MNDVPLFVFKLAVLVVSVMIHEVSHGVVALWQGDPTAKLAGRLTMNPMKHLDLWGSVLVPIGFFIMSGGGVFGWAKPVPYNPYNLRNQKWGCAMVGLAGPFSNLLIAILFSFFLRSLSFSELNFSFVQNALSLFAHIIWINILLGVFNLVPIPPLDGSKLLFSILPPSMNSLQVFLERNGRLILLFFIFFGFRFIVPVIGILFHLITGMRA